MTARLLRLAGLMGLYVAVVAVETTATRLELREHELAAAREQLAQAQAAGIATVLVGAMVDAADREDLDDGLEAFDASDCLTEHDLAGIR